METIKVNMSPNPLDVQTIHASQNDTEARQWEFELHNNGELIDTSEVTDQIVFKAYKGGTEQILPENTSTPTTSPFKGDIKYPQGLLTDQEFLYRESPTEEDGLAKITDIKGNTLGWNQLVENGDFSTSSGWTGQFVTVTISNNVASVRQDRAGDYVALRKSNLQGLTGHKYLVVADVKSAKKTAIAFYLSNAYSSAYDIQANTRTVVHSIITVSNANDGGFNVYTNRKVELAEGDVVEIYHVMCFDLTKMGLDSITDPSEFTSLFPKPYYDYNAGTLLSFNGTGIKTTNKNFVTNFSADSTTSNISFTQADGVIHATGLSNGTTRTPTFTDAILMKKGTYVLSGSTGGSTNSYALQVQSDITGTWTNVVYCYDGDAPFTLEQDCNIRIRGRFSNVQTTNYDVTFYPMVRFADTGSTFEPYTSSTLSLPISQYFPTGMKDVPDYTNGGKIYDEMTSNKADTRVGAVDLGSLEWTYQSGNVRFNAYQALLSLAKLPSTNNEVANIICAKYGTVSSNGTVSESNNLSVGLSTNGSIQIRDTNFTDATAFKESLQGQYLYYALATYEETSFTTASLVTENAEIPLSNEDGVLIGKCTEQLSENPGFIDAKIKLADVDGECYSNKIQLHVERSPQ